MSSWYLFRGIDLEMCIGLKCPLGLIWVLCIRPKWIPYQLAYVCAMIIAWLSYGSCPLTALENRIRGEAGMLQVRDSFVTHIMREWFGLQFSTSSVEIVAYSLTTLTALLFIAWLAKKIFHLITSNRPSNEQAVF